MLCGSTGSTGPGVKAMGSEANVDCDAGRRLGCRTFCCHLLIRLDSDETVPGGSGDSGGILEKAADGACIHLERDTEKCGIWAQRPHVCREYHCNGDLLLQVVLREGFTSLAALVKAAATAYVPKDTYVRIPTRD